MHKIVGKPRLVGMAGSLRRSSYSSAVLSGLRENLLPAAQIETCDLRLPLYNEDEDGPAAPEEVRTFREAIWASDGVVIVTPEYNHGIPGVLKNALDWASRPFGESALIDKPVLVISVSPAFTGGVRAQAQVNETLLAIGAGIVTGPQVVIGSITGKIQDGLLVDGESLRFALGALDRLIAMSRNDRTSQRLLA
ncbi:NAD(P)H-dependent oxidoreductase [Tardiphaga sp.]|uniref:NADPH-dependent FMN reductase n=1 Tax=Tardiphaga sp. TaxID=1926292 RepID=UPI00263494F0|nr:NAD(P)H-dependent oxidoreductase [Tardiphaga sp.]MDB5617832.1 NADPH-dependent reductase [Tardiphaga sp.]